jgi:spermidine/putrescine transport system substrate-binding protein
MFNKSKLVVLTSILVVLISACTGGDSAKAEINVYNWISYMPAEVLDGFEKETGIKVNYEEFDSSETMMAKIASGAKYDVAFPGIDFVPLMVEKDLLLQIDHTKVPNFKNIDAGVIMQTQEADPGNKFSMPYNIGAVGVIYWKDKVANPGDSITLIERPELAGKVVLLDDTREIFGIALKTLGFSVNTVDQAQIDQATDLILKWRKNILGFDNDQLAAVFNSQDAWVAVGYPENVLSDMEPEIAQQVGFFLQKETGAKYLDCMVILKDSKNVDAAHAFINYIYRPENLAKVFDLYGYPGISEVAQALRTKQPFYSASEIEDHEFKKPLGEDVYKYTQAWEERIKVGE